MKRPLHVSILGRPFKVEWRGLGENDAGYCYVAQQRMEIDTELSPDQERSTVVHEAMHAILHITGHDEGTTLTHRQEEAITRAMGYALVTLIRENPHLVDWLTDR